LMTMARRKKEGGDGGGKRNLSEKIEVPAF
jgi:hypothetical protein